VKDERGKRKEERGKIIVPTLQRGNAALDAPASSNDRNELKYFFSD
jgi:hypothetical protein